MQRVCVIGVGFVGEHLVNIFKSKYHVVGVDISQKRIDQLKLKYNDNNVHFQANYENLNECNVFIISVPTLVDNNKNIDVTYLHDVKQNLLSIAQPNSLIVIESSVYVGATRELFGEFIDKNILVAFSPERVDPGRSQPPYEDIPKIVSGLTDESLLACKNVYEHVFNNIVTVSTTECAEMCKLYENCFRMINIAYVNEISDMCSQLDINVHEMINASSTKPFGFMPFYPGVGVGGHCIPVNPYYLFKNGNLPLLYFSTLTMERRPYQKAKQIVQMYPNAERILVIGIGFKKGESVVTNSPSYELVKALFKYGKNVKVYDPFLLKETPALDINIINQTQLFDSDYMSKTFDLIIQTHPLTLKEHIAFEGPIYSFV